MGMLEVLKMDEKNFRYKGSFECEESSPPLRKFWPITRLVDVGFTPPGHMRLPISDNTELSGVISENLGSTLSTPSV